MVVFGQIWEKIGKSFNLKVSVDTGSGLALGEFKKFFRI